MKAIVTVVGKDQVGIIAGVCNTLAASRINVLDISQTIIQDYFTMTMLVDAEKTDIPFADLVAALEGAGTKLGLAIHAQREDLFIAMHRI